MSEVRFGNYRVVKALGSGVISTIYQAVQEPLGRVVVIKALKTPIAPTSSFGEQIEREAKILSDLVHPNIVLLLELGRSGGGQPFLVLEHVDGPSLEQLLAKKKKLGTPAALAIACGVAHALSHAHERGVVHRDVKPSNVLLSKSGAVKLVDFGIAQRARMASVSDAFAAQGITPSGRIAPEPVKDAFGTPAYMSPEQILGDFVDGRSDVFSLGVVLYQMLCGSRPFEAPGGEEAARRTGTPRVRRDTPAELRERAPQVPRSVERIVMRMLEKAMDERYATTDLARERLETALRSITREDPTALVRAALVDAGFVPAGGRFRQPEIDAPRAGGTSLGRVWLGQGAVALAFAAAAFALGGGSRSKDDVVTASDPAEATGSLRVNATPWAAVRVDGRDLETTPFARGIPLAPGRHWVTLSHPDAQPVEREVTIVAGEVVTLDVTMNVALEDGGGR